MELQIMAALREHSERHQERVDMATGTVSNTASRLEELASCYREEIDINKYDVLWIWKLPLFEARKS
jgi:hypothetical protein